jgi:CheY-like chemotaxis protein
MPHKILLVEDDPNFRTVLALALEHHGYVVRQVACVQNALETLDHEIPDMIISDLRMNGMDGRALHRHACADSRLSKIPFVFLSAFIEPDGTGDLPDLPVNYCLSKQSSFPQLLASIDELLRRHRQEPASSSR